MSSKGLEIFPKLDDVIDMSHMTKADITGLFIERARAKEKMAATRKHLKGICKWYIQERADDQIAAVTELSLRHWRFCGSGAG